MNGADKPESWLPAGGGKLYYAGCIGRNCAWRGRNELSNWWIIAARAPALRSVAARAAVNASAVA